MEKCLRLESLPEGEWLCPECVRVFGAHLEWQGSDRGPVCTVFFDGPFDGSAASTASAKVAAQPTSGHKKAKAAAAASAGSGGGAPKPVPDVLASITADLTQHEFAIPFHQPVDPGLAAYYRTITRPVDLGTIANRLLVSACALAAVPVVLVIGLYAMQRDEYMRPGLSGAQVNVHYLTFCLLPLVLPRPAGV
jgi:hypothetical protein